MDIQRGFAPLSRRAALFIAPQRKIRARHVNSHIPHLILAEPGNIG